MDARSGHNLSAMEREILELKKQNLWLTKSVKRQSMEISELKVLVEYLRSRLPFTGDQNKLLAFNSNQRQTSNTKTAATEMKGADHHQPLTSGKLSHQYSPKCDLNQFKVVRKEPDHHQQPISVQSSSSVTGKNINITSVSAKPKPVLLGLPISGQLASAVTNDKTTITYDTFQNMWLKPQPSKFFSFKSKMGYTSKEDKVILEWVRNKTNLGGNIVWKKLEASGLVQNRSWKSLRYRYLRYLKS